jgi:hypothetical protein
MTSFPYNYNQTTSGFMYHVLQLFNWLLATGDWELMNFKQGKFYGQASGPISTGKLHASLHFHTQPINLVVFQGSSAPEGEGYLILGLVSRLYAFSVYHIRM